LVDNAGSLIERRTLEEMTGRSGIAS
jgi:hypothetical protein